MEDEIWKNVEGCDGLYQVSSFGKIKSFKRNAEGKILKQYNNGYYQIRIFKNGIRKTIKTHRLVAQAFIPNLNNLPEIHHKDHNKHNNNANNLQWITRRDHVKITQIDGLHPKGSKNGLAKLTENDILKIRNILRNEKNMTFLSIAEIYNVSSQTIGDIVNRKTWKHI